MRAGAKILVSQFFQSPLSKKPCTFISTFTGRCDRAALRVALRVQPKAGDALVFPHGLHPGCLGSSASVVDWGIGGLRLVVNKFRTCLGVPSLRTQAFNCEVFFFQKSRLILPYVSYTISSQKLLTYLYSVYIYIYIYM